ncbi:hypothetical protein RIF29_34979 [Crotalaria pallida]|uniref:Uncharacterized protein n=1 Tax=Crotalaria pallida TaxID=3830 RepID=A0AAN9EAN9_CROPI
MEPERSKPLHNFSMPRLKWGNQRLLRCINLTTSTPTHQPSSNNKRKLPLPFSNTIDDINAVREKLMIDLRLAANNLKVSIFDQRSNLGSPKKKKNKLVEASKEKMVNGRREFCVSLTKEEVDQDFWALVGTKPPRRPKKRPRILQRQLDTLFPGLWLTEVNAESYKVPDDPE